MANQKEYSPHPLSSKVISVSNVKKLMSFYKNKDTQISPDAVKNMQKVLIEHTRWITNEAEKLAIYEGAKRIKDRHIRDAVKIYFGIRGKI